MDNPKVLFLSFAGLIVLLIAVVAFTGGESETTPPQNANNNAAPETPAGDPGSSAPGNLEDPDPATDPIVDTPADNAPKVTTLSTAPGAADALAEQDRQEEKIDEKTLIEYYPAGKRIESATEFQISGMGRHRDWGFAGTVYFTYVGLMNLDTEVVSNDGNQIVSIVYVREVSQHRLTSEFELQLALPDDPLAKMLLTTADMTFKKFPLYRGARLLFEAADVADPNLRKTLTWIADRVKDAGYDLGKVMIASRVEELSGIKLQVTYLNGWGVGETTVLEGGAVREDRLKAYARCSSQLMDYYIFPEAKSRQPGDEWSVDTGQVAGMFLPSTNLDVSGQVHLRLSSKSGSQAELEIPDGTVIVVDETDRARAEGRMDVTSGALQYDLDSLFIEAGKIDFRMQSLWQSRDHLLFGAEDIKDLNVTARYSARKIEP